MYNNVLYHIHSQGGKGDIFLAEMGNIELSSCNNSRLAKCLSQACILQEALGAVVVRVCGSRNGKTST